MSAVHVEILNRARNRLRATIEDPYCASPYICDNVADVATTLANCFPAQAQVYRDAHEHICGRIDFLLEGQFCLVDWLAKHEHITDEERDDLVRERFNVPDLFAKLQRTRLAWVDDMIEYWRDR